MYLLNPFTADKHIKVDIYTQVELDALRMQNRGTYEEIIVTIIYVGFIFYLVY
ncbi:hypothetical protein [Clostridium sp.]|uniref:hypothetical protein n=1 Tax=Clostridium sp. TaxID=1506 RepID=UPI003F815B5C